MCRTLHTPVLEELLLHSAWSVDSEVKLPGFGSCLNRLMPLKPWVSCSALCSSVSSTVKRDEKMIYHIGWWWRLNELILVKAVDQSVPGT